MLGKMSIHQTIMLFLKRICRDPSIDTNKYKKYISKSRKQWCQYTGSQISKAVRISKSEYQYQSTTRGKSMNINQYQYQKLEYQYQLGFCGEYQSNINIKIEYQYQYLILTFKDNS